MRHQTPAPKLHFQCSEQACPACICRTRREETADFHSCKSGEPWRNAPAIHHHPPSATARARTAWQLDRQRCRSTWEGAVPIGGPPKTVARAGASRRGIRSQTAEAVEQAMTQVWRRYGPARRGRQRGVRRARAQQPSPVSPASSNAMRPGSGTGAVESVAVKPVESSL